MLSLNYKHTLLNFDYSEECYQHCRKDEKDGVLITTLVNNIKSLEDRYTVLRKDIPLSIQRPDSTKLNKTCIQIAYLKDKPQTLFPIHAYLPVENNISLPIMLQADWMLNTSRENITDCAWNVFLRDKLAQLLSVVLNECIELLPKISNLPLFWRKFVKHTLKLFTGSAGKKLRLHMPSTAKLDIPCEYYDSARIYIVEVATPDRQAHLQSCGKFLFSC